MPKTDPLQGYPQPSCRRCDAAVTVSRAQQKLKRRGKTITHVYVSCANGHEWWSTSKRALAIAKAADDAAKAKKAAEEYVA
jgi:phosphoribosylamine-glycine ligase